MSLVANEQQGAAPEPPPLQMAIGKLSKRFLGMH